MSHRAENLKARIVELMETASLSTLEEVVRTLEAAQSTHRQGERSVGIEDLRRYADALQLSTFAQTDVRDLWRYLCTTKGIGLDVRQRKGGRQEGFNEGAWGITVLSLQQFALSLLKGEVAVGHGSLPPLPSEQKTLLLGFAASL